MTTPGDSITLSVSTIVAHVGALTVQINHPMIAMQLVPAILPLPFANERKTQFVRDAIRGAVADRGESMHDAPAFFKPRLVQYRRHGAAAKALSLKLRKDGPADLVDRLALPLAFPHAHRARGLAATLVQDHFEEPRSAALYAVDHTAQLFRHIAFGHGAAQVL